MQSSINALVQRRIMCSDAETTSSSTMGTAEGGRAAHNHSARRIESAIRWAIPPELAGSLESDACKLRTAGSSVRGYRQDPKTPRSYGRMMVIERRQSGRQRIEG